MATNDMAPRLPVDVKQRLMDSIASGKGLYDLIDEFGLGKTTIYYYFRKIRGKKYKDVIINAEDEEKIGEFIGVFAGDGNFTFNKKKHEYKIRIHFAESERDLARHYGEIIEFLFSKKPRHLFAKSMLILDFSSKKIYEFIQQYLQWKEHKKTTTIKLSSTSHPPAFWIGFMRGLIDSDGYIPKSGKRVSYGSVSKELKDNFVFNLVKLNITHRQYIQYANGKNPFYRIDITGENASKFCSAIAPVKATGLARI